METLAWLIDSSYCIHSKSNTIESQHRILTDRCYYELCISLVTVSNFLFGFGFGFVLFLQFYSRFLFLITSTMVLKSKWNIHKLLLLFFCSLAPISGLNASQNVSEKSTNSFKWYQHALYLFLYVFFFFYGRCFWFSIVNATHTHTHTQFRTHVYNFKIYKSVS